MLRMISRYLVLSLALLAGAPSAAPGQGLIAGDSIRVDVRGVEAVVGVPAPRGTKPLWTEGTVVQLTPDSLWYRAAGDRGSSSVSLANAIVQRRMDGDQRRAGTAVGGLLLGVIGAWGGYANYDPNPAGSCGFSVVGCGGGSPNPLSRGQETAAYAIGGALLGGFFGYVLGTKIKRWETVEFDRLMTGGGSLGVSFNSRW
jgi:hypothetical protein